MGDMGVGAAEGDLFGLVASWQIRLRKLNGWQKIGAVLNQHTAVAA